MTITGPARSIAGRIKDDEERIRQLERRLRGESEKISGTGARTASLIIAAHNAPEAWRATADLVCPGEDDQLAIQKAVDQIRNQGHAVDAQFSPGDFNISDLNDSTYAQDSQAALRFPVGSRVQGCGSVSVYGMASSDYGPNGVNLYPHDTSLGGGLYEVSRSTTFWHEYSAPMNNYYTFNSDEGNVTYADFNAIAGADGLWGADADFMDGVTGTGIGGVFDNFLRVTVAGYDLGLNSSGFGTTYLSCVAAHCEIGFRTGGNLGAVLHACTAEDCASGFFIGGNSSSISGCLASGCGVGFETQANGSSNTCFTGCRVDNISGSLGPAFFSLTTTTGFYINGKFTTVVGCAVDTAGSAAGTRGFVLGAGGSFTVDNSSIQGCIVHDVDIGLELEAGVTNSFMANNISRDVNTALLDNSGSGTNIITPNIT